MGATNCPETPRQKMISMMYLVYTALLALNVSTDVLNGFSVVQKSLKQSIVSTDKKNSSQLAELESMESMNKQKIGPWLVKAKDVAARSEALYQQIEDLKVQIVKTVDGPEGNVDSINAKDNLDVSYQVAWYGPGNVEGKGLGCILRDSIDAYSAYAQAIVRDTCSKLNENQEALIETIKSNFNTEDQPNPLEPTENMTWIVRTFEHMPVMATMTLLTKIQQDIRNTENDVIRHIIDQVDAGDFRVNKITAEVIPVSSYVTRGGTYEARIILAAIDSTAKPKITVNGKPLEGEVYKAGCGTAGSFNIKGTIELPRADGSTQTYDFNSNYIVGEPTAIISADMMNVFYAGIDNPISVSVPGVPAQNINVNITNGSLSKKGNGWIVRPTKVGQNCIIAVSAKMEGGKIQAIGSKPFRVKALPPPVGYIAYEQNGNPAKYKGGKPFSKGLLIGAQGVKAELNDADLDVRYNVLGFNITYFDSMGNGMIESATGSNFTEKQRNVMRKMNKGKTFYISNIRAKGPDGIEQQLPPIEVKIN